MHVDLWLLLILKISHYVLIKDFDRFMTNKAKPHGKKHFYQYCLQYFSSANVLECIRNCQAINHTKSILLPEEDAYINFQNFERLKKAPFIIYCDFESVLIPPTTSILAQILKNIKIVLFAVMATN